jgi:CelD/BcsL family acetyltransferase involved in cellulose biosynthesis
VQLAPRSHGLTVLGPADLADLRQDWRSLADRCPGHYLSQTWRWAATAWNTVAAPRRRKLHILTLRSEGRLVAVWPVVSYRDGRLQIVRQLSAEGSEYVSPLIEPGPASAEHLKMLCRAVRALGDLLLLPHVRRDDPLADFLQRHRLRSIEDNFLKAPWIALRSYPDWASYLSTVSHSHVRGLNREYRRLSRQGEVGFRVEASHVVETEIDQMLVHKDAWMVRRSRSNDWLDTPEYRAFLRAMSSGNDRHDGLTLFTLRLNGLQIAAQLSAVDDRRVEALIRAYDSKWSRRSPGDILLQECVHWAFEHRLDYDFRLGDEAYKAKWAHTNADIFTCRLALSLRGLVAVWFWRLRRTAQRVRSAIRSGAFSG